MRQAASAQNHAIPAPSIGNKLGLEPKPLKFIELALLFLHEVYDEITTIEEDPAAVSDVFVRIEWLDVVFRKILIQLAYETDHVCLAAHGSDDEVVGPITH